MHDGTGLFYAHFKLRIQNILGIEQNCYRIILQNIKSQRESREFQYSFTLNVKFQTIYSVDNVTAKNSTKRKKKKINGKFCSLHSSCIARWHSKLILATTRGWKQPKPQYLITIADHISPRSFWVVFKNYLHFDRFCDC